MENVKGFAKLGVEIQSVPARPRGLLPSRFYLVSITFFRENHTIPLINFAQPKNFYQIACIYGTIHNMATNEQRLTFNTCVTINKPITSTLTCESQFELTKVNSKLATYHCY